MNNATEFIEGYIDEIDSELKLRSNNTPSNESNGESPVRLVRKNLRQRSQKLLTMSNLLMSFQNQLKAMLRNYHRVKPARPRQTLVRLLQVRMCLKNDEPELNQPLGEDPDDLRPAGGGG